MSTKESEPLKRYSVRNSGHEEDCNSYYEDADGPFVLHEDAIAFIDGLKESRRLDYELVKAFDVYGTGGDVSSCLRELLMQHGEYKQSFLSVQADNASLKSKLEAQEWRPEVRAMADAMEARLKANEHRGGWKEMSDFDLRERIEANLRDLKFWQKAAIGRTRQQNLEARIRTCADIANFAMMLMDNRPTAT